MSIKPRLQSISNKLKINKRLSFSLIILTVAAMGLSVIAPLSASADSTKTIPATFGKIKFIDYKFEGKAAFRVRQSLASCYVLSGSYTFTLNFGGTNYKHTLFLTPSGFNFSGPDNIDGVKVGNVSGSTSGNTFTYVGTYFSGYKYTVNGVINPDETLSVTSWTSSDQQMGGSWTVTGKAYAMPCVSEGKIVIRTLTGALVTKAKISYVETKDRSAWFAGLDSNGKWLVVLDHDGGSVQHDYFGFYQTDQSSAEQAVLAERPPVSTKLLAVTWGHLIVHPDLRR